MKDDLNALADMAYSGRGIIIGMTPNGDSFVGYSLTGRSPSSQARRLVECPNTGIIRTDVTDEEQLKKGSPALLLYDAIMPIWGECIVVSNGAQTKLLYSSAKKELSENRSTITPNNILGGAMGSSFWEHDIHQDRLINISSYEPDDPNFTPRICGVVFSDVAGLSVTSKDYKRQVPLLKRTQFPLNPGVGHVVTTYKGGNESPLKSFQGKPLIVGIESVNAENLVNSIYDAIHGGEKEGDNFRVAAAVMLRNHKTGEIDTAIMNRFELGA